MVNLNNSKTLIMFHPYDVEAVLHNGQIALTDQRKMIILPFSDLVRVEGDGSYCTVYSTTHAPITLSKNLGTLVSQLPDWMFFRTHQSHLINLKMVQRIEKEDGCELVLKDGSQVPVARRRKDALMRMLLGKHH